MQHEGMGVARRAAEHVRLRTEREAQEAQIEQPDVVNALLLDFFEGIGNE